MASTRNTLLELMERTGISSENQAIAYLRDAFRELQSMKVGNVKTYKISVVAGTKAYALPTDFGAVLSVYRLTENNKYRRIPKLTDLLLFTE